MSTHPARSPFTPILSRCLLAFCGRALARAALAGALLPALLAPLGCSSSTSAPTIGDDAATPPGMAAPFTIALAADKLPVLQGATASVDVVLTRTGDFAGAVTLGAIGLPAGATMVSAVIAAGQTTATLTVSADATAPHSLPSPVTIQATAGADVAGAPLTVTIYGPPGSLDTSFGGGKVVVPVGAGDDYAYAVAVDAAGRLLVAGRAAEGLGDFALVRLDRDGTLDTTFGTGGRVTTDFAGGADTAYAVAVQPDGKIVVAGTAAMTGTGQDFAVARYLDSGAPDPTFGQATGKVTTAFGADSDTAYTLLLQPDGKIVLGGDSNQGSSATGVDFAVARYGADGALDATFGTAGKVTTSVAANGARDSIYALTLQTVAGVPLLLAAGGEGDFQLARYTMTGALDPTFGTTGTGTIAGLLGTSIGAARAVQVAADGKILVAGHDNHDFALVRLDAAGIPDVTFGTGGRSITAVSATNWDEVQAMAIAADGKIVLAGWAYEGGSSSANVVLGRYGADGLLDATFGTAGLVTTPVAAGMRSDQANAVVLQADGRVPAIRVVAAGFASASNNDFVVTRYWQ